LDSACKVSQNNTYFDQTDGEWEVEKGPWKGYSVIDADYQTNTVTQAEAIGYGTDENGKWIDLTVLDIELVRVQYGTKVQWVIMEKGAELDGEQMISSSFWMTAGQARSRNVGAQENREVATKLTGYGLEDQTEGGLRSLQMSTISLTLYPAWTYWANGDEGNQDFEATVQMITDYLNGKGYTEEPEW
jgi:hypothetical protein